MKRSTCLSAFLLALSVTSIASAAPDKKQEPTPRLVAQAATNVGSDVAQQSDGAGTGSSPTAAPADGSQTTEGATTQPAVTVGTSTPAPATDTSQAAAEEPKKKPKPRPFAGTQIYNQNSMTTGTIFRGQQQDYNPTVESTLWLLPRYAINDAFQIRGRLVVAYEYTNSDTTTFRNEPVLSDTGLSLFYRKIPEIPGVGIKPMVALNVGLPTSKASRARTVIFNPGATLQLSKAVEHVLGGELMFLSSVIYSHPIYQQRVPAVLDERDNKLIACTGAAAAGCGDLFTGLMNSSDNLSYTFLVSGEWGKFSPALYYLGASQWAYSPKQVNESDVVAGAPNRPVAGNPDPTGVRQTHYFSAWVDYNVNPWLTAEVGYWNARSALNEAGQRGNIIWDRYQDTRVYLGFNVNIDNLMKALEGGETDAGIVRAHNTKRPMWTF